MTSRLCPEHGRVLDRLTVTSKEDCDDVQIDRCADCGGLWFDAGELELIGEVTAKLTHGVTKLPCPICRQPMLAAEVPRRVMAFRCDDCFGTWIDGLAVRMMVRRELPSAVVRPRGSVGFICASCAHRFPYSDGAASPQGLICRNCVVNPRPGRIPEGHMTGLNITPGPRKSLSFGLGDAIGSLSLLFEDDD